MDETEAKIRHLELVQSIVGRMAQNSFMLKGWTVTVVAALLALAPQKTNSLIAVLAIVSSVVFWALDSYFLRQEKMFRALYNQIRKSNTFEGEDFFDLNTTAFSAKVKPWFCVALSPTVFLFHGAVLAAAITGIVLYR